MSHVKVYHSILLIGPHNGEIAKVHNILNAKRIHLWRNGKQHFHVCIEARAGIPLIELAGRSYKSGWERTHDGMISFIILIQCRLRRPIVTVRSEEHTSELQSRQYLV